MTTNLKQFAQELDTLLGLHPGPAPALDDTALQTASLLMGLDLDVGAAPRPELRTRWISHTRTLNSQRSNRSLFTTKWAWIVALLLVLALLIAFRQPVFAAVGRLFGFIYIQDSGFLPADSTLVLVQPVVQSHNGRSLLALRGTRTPGETTLTLEYSDTASPADGAQLETLTGDVIPLSWWEYNPNAPDSHGVRLFFSTLPEGVTQTTLVLPEGWRLPLTWIPASQSGLPDVQVIPYPDAATPSPADACTEKNGMQLCVLAATASTESTSILVQAQSTSSDLSPGDIWQGLVWQTETEKATLRDSQGNTFPMNGAQGSTLTFPPLPGSQQVTLSVPAVLASVSIPEQTIVVDVGSDPQPDTVIPLDVSIQVLDMTVHFSQGTFVGDGVNSLRLTLNADPVQTVNGLTPAALEIGKPDRVDDLYGTGMLAGSKDIFIELVRPQEKVTGTITIPVVGTTVIVNGPFEFTFTLPDEQSITPTPAVADPNTFSPAPAPTPLPFDHYYFSGQTLEAGDLLYVVWHNLQSDIYRFSPSMNIDHGLFLTLPGHVSSINIHPNRQGLDYLTGIYDKDSNVLDDPHLYTFRFEEPTPRLLALTPPGLLLPFQLAWSADGQLLAFDTAPNAPGAMGSIGWIDLACRENGECPINILDDPTGNGLGLTDLAFSPNGKWLALNASDSESGAGEVYMLPFENHHPGKLYNLSQSRWFADSIYSWISEDTLVWMCDSGNALNPTSSLCLKKVTERTSSSEIIFSFNDWQYFGMAPNGEYFWQVVINRQVEREQQIWLHDRTGASDLLTSAPWINLDYGKPAFSMDGRYLAYTSTTDSFKSEPDTLYVIDTTTKQVIITYALQEPIGWLGWVR
jgi:hypothetical protein